MCDYEQLLNDADMIGLQVIEKQFKSHAKGLCKGSKIGIKKDMTNTEKACVLAEEIGHYHTTVGNILNQENASQRKQEKIARKWAVNRMLKIEDLFDAVLDGCQTLYDVAEYLGVTEIFLYDAIAVFKQKYGMQYKWNGLTLTFTDHGFFISQNGMK